MPSSRTVARDEIKRLSSHSLSPARSPGSTKEEGGGCGGYNYNMHEGNCVFTPPTQPQQKRDSDRRHRLPNAAAGVSHCVWVRSPQLKIICKKKKIHVLKRRGGRGNKDRHRWKLAAVCAQLGAAEGKRRAARLVPEPGC